jgi:NAD(P)-dependent dehydrogenase (short-subunit alcohol dehydrogenase family)
MKRNRLGSIVNLSSILGIVGYSEDISSDGFSPYTHSKGGVIQFTRDMAVQFAKDNIRVNALCPGFTYTPQTKRLTDDDEMKKKLESLHPMGRLGRPDEIAKAALFLASDESSYVTGASLPVDGGYTAK